MPPGFYLDESSNAYNAYCISYTGSDEYGTTWPVFFRCFDDYHDPAMIYLLAPLVKTFGLQPAVARFPSGLFLLLASITFAFLAHRYTQNCWLSLLGGFCFSVLPWTFVVSRIITGGYTAMLWGMILGWLLLLLALEKKSSGCAVGAGVAWAFAMYAHNIGRPMTALLLAGFALAYFGVLKTEWRVGAAFMAGWLVALAPMAISVARSSHSLTSRFYKIGIFKDHPSGGELFSRAASRYVEYFSPQFLFFNGDTNLRHHSGYGGELYLSLIPMILAGLYFLLRSSGKRPACRFVVFGLLVYPAAAVLTQDHMHSGRSINGAIFWALTATIGADFLWRKKGVGQLLLLLAGSAAIVEGTLYLKDYFGAYQVRCRPAFQAAFTGALDDCFRALREGETLYISRSVLGSLTPPQNQDFKPFCYADILFFGKIDPATYMRTGIPKDRVSLYEGTIQRPGLLLRCNLSLVKPGTAGRLPDFTLNNEPLPVGAKLVQTVPVTSLMEYEIFEVQHTSR